MKKPNSSLITKLVIAGICGIVLVVATFTVPRRAGTLDIGDRGLKGGPDSYFRHIYEEKRIRAEVGYGYVDVLTDIGTKHLIENTMVPLLRGGQTTQAVEAAARALQESLSGKNATHRTKIDIRGELPSLVAELKRRAGLVARILSLAHLASISDAAPECSEEQE